MIEPPHNDDNNKRAVRHLGSQTALLMTGTGFTFIIGMPFQIYLARTFGTEGLGYLGVAEALVLTIGGFLSFGLSPLALRFIPEYRITRQKRLLVRLVVVGISALTILGTLGATLLALLIDQLSAFVYLAPQTIDLIGVLALLLPLSMMSFFLSQALRGFQELRIVVLSTTFLALLTKIFLTFFLFVTMGRTPLSYAWAMVGAQAVAVIPMALKLKRLISILPTDASPTQTPWRAWTHYASTNYLSGLLNTLTGDLDRVIIGILLGPSSVGVLIVVRQLLQFPAVFLQTVLVIVSPIFAQLKAAGDVKGLSHQLHLANDWIFRMAAPLVLLLIVRTEDVLALYGYEFSSQGSGLLRICSAAALLNFATGPVGILLNMTGHHVALLRLMIVSSLITLTSYFILVPWLGVAGVGVAVFLGTLVNKLAAVWLVRERLQISWYEARFRNWVLPSISTTVVVFVLRIVLPPTQDLAVATTVLAANAAMAYTVFFGINLLAGLHKDDTEVVVAVRDRVIAFYKGKR